MKAFLYVIFDKTEMVNGLLSKRCFKRGPPNISAYLIDK